MPEIQDVSPTSSNSNLTSNADGSTPSQSANGRMLAIACSQDGQVVFSGSFSNIWVSGDNGQTWDQATWPQPASGQFGVPGALGGWCVADIAVSPTDPKTVLAITRNDRSGASSGGAGSSDSGIWRSTDGGSNWSLQHQFPKVSSGGMQVPPPAGQLVWAPGSDRLVYAAGGGVLSISQDGGVSFQDFPPFRSRINHVAVAPVLPSIFMPLVVYALGDGVMYVSFNGGPWIRDLGPIQSNWGGAVGPDGNSIAPSVLVVSPRSPFEVFLVADANGGQTVSPIAVIAPYVSVYGSQQHFVYPDLAGTLWDSWWDGNGWNLQQINGAGGQTPDGPPTVGGPFVSAYNNQQHFAYVDNVGTIWDSWWDGDHNVWKLQQINGAGGQTPQGPPAVGGPFVSVYNNQQHFAYVDNVGTIWDSWWDGDHNVWKLQQINGAGGQTPDGPPVVGGPFVSTYNNQQHFASVDNVGTIWDSWWDGDHNVWKLQQINGAGGQTPQGPPAVGGPFVSVYNNQQHFAYVDNVGTIWDSWWDGDHNVWKLQQINAAGGQTPDGPPAVGVPFVSVYNNQQHFQQHFAYVDKTGTIWDSWWDGDNAIWNLQQINGAAGKTPNSVQAVGVPFVSAYEFQQHFTYLDSSGTIWDSWWDGDNWKFQQINKGPMLWRGNFGQFVNTSASVWQRVVPPDLNGQVQDSGSVFIATTQAGHGDLLFYGAQRTRPYVGPLEPSSASDWRELDEGINVHWDLHGILLSPDFAATLQNGDYQALSGTIWLMSDGGIYRSIDGGKHFKAADNVKTLSCVNVAGVAIEGQTALSLNTGDNDGFFSMDGGKTWTSQDYGGGDNDCSYADPLRPQAMIVFTPRWDQDGNSVGAANGRTVAVYQTLPGQLPNVALGGNNRYIVPGPSLNDGWNAGSKYGLRGYRPIVLNLPGDDGWESGDYIFIRFRTATSDAVLLRTQKILEIDSRDDWDTVATSPYDGARVFQQGPVLPAADAGVVQASGGHIQTVFYMGGGSKNRLWKWTGGRTEGPAVRNGPFASVYGSQQHFAYVDSSGTIWDSWWDGNSWNLQQINGAGGQTPDGPPAVGGPFVSVYNNQQHFAYVDNVGTIWDSWWDGDHNVWKLQQINLTGGQTPDGPPAVGGPFVSTYNNQQHFAYVDSSGTIWDSWWDGNGWNLQQINGAGGQTPDGPPAVGGPFVSVYNNQQHFAYVDNVGTIWDSWWDGDHNVWKLQQINGAGGQTPDGPPAVGGLFVSVYNNQQHFAYMDNAGTIRDSWWDGNGWNLQQINGAGGQTPSGPIAVGGPFVSVYNNQQHFAYVDSSGTIWDSWWDGNGWSLQQINAAGGQTPSGPVAVGGPFVSVYDNQQHFAYTDSFGTIWDSWWDGDNAIWNLQQINTGDWQALVPGATASQARRFFVSPYNPNLVYLLDAQDVKRSDDGGRTWSVDTSLENQLSCGTLIPIGRPDSSELIDVVLTDMQFDPLNPLRRFAVGEGGAFFTNDGVNWDRLLDTGALPGRPTNCYYDSVSNPSERALYVALVGRSLVKISPLP